MPPKGSGKKRPSSAITVDKTKTTQSVAASKAKKTKTEASSSSSSSSINHNQNITDVLGELAKNEMKLGNKMKASVYWKAITAVKNHPMKLQSGKEAMKLPGVGKKIGDKIDEIIATGSLERLSRDQENEELKSINELMKVPGISAERARQLFEEFKFKNLEDLTKNSNVLTTQERNCLGYAHDFAIPVSKENVDLISVLMESIAKEVDDYDIIVNLTGPARLGQESASLEFLMTVPDLSKTKIKAAGDAMIAAMHKSGHVLDEVSRGPGNFHCAWALSTESGDARDEETAFSRSKTTSNEDDVHVEIERAKTKKPVAFSFSIPTFDQIESSKPPAGAEDFSPEDSAPKTATKSSAPQRSSLSKSMFASAKKAEKEANKPMKHCAHVILKWCHHSRYACTLLFSTGPPKYMNLLKEAADEKGYILAESGISKKGSLEDDVLEPETEEDIFKFLGMEFVPPDVRLALAS